ncbi:MAG: FG-GAP-like repeat-containing protein [Fuerstiella sp.]
MTSRASTQRIIFLTLLVLAGAVAVHQFRQQQSPQPEADELLRRARLLGVRGEPQKAEELARQAIELNDRLIAAYLFAAECAMTLDRHEQVLKDLSHVTDVESSEWIIARRLAADVLHNRVFRFREAERAYQDVLAVEPDDVFANDGYARLLGLCGRRSDAIPHVLRLVKAGQDTDLLMLLARESGALNDPEMLDAARKADPSDPNPLLGQAAAAASAQNAALALQILRTASSMLGLPRDFHGRLGRQLLDNRRFDELRVWSRSITADSASAECWLVRAELAVRANDDRGAIRCYWEAVKLSPESLPAINQLAGKLTSERQEQLAAPFFARVRHLNDFRERQRVAIMSNQQPSYADVFLMIKSYCSVGRFWEAFAWGKLTLEVEPQSAELRQLLADLEEKLPELSLQLTSREFNPAHQIDLSHYPVPSLGLDPGKRTSGLTSDDISFRQQRREIGFDFQYFDGTNDTTGQMFEFGGGGIAVIDLDNDEAPDLFCAQGRTWDKPVSEPEGHHDRLFRNLQGHNFVDVVNRSGMNSDTGFGQGAAAGDINNDGFVDLYVANIGPNTLWRNNGDGTFTDISDSLTDRTSQWTTSCLIADLNGDLFPDLYDVNYLSGDDLFDRVCTGEDGGTIQCSPYEFEPAMDRVWLGNGEGDFVEAPGFLTPPPNGKGLGVVAFDVGNHRLSLFVSNDTTANFFYTALSSDARSLTESATTAGLAFNGEGKAEACMGIAVGDCTQDGRLDILVTNFLYESNTLYSPLDDLVFEDKTRVLGLHDSTLPVLGWGTQFLDANLDRRLELFVVNGYPQDLTKYGTPYRMRPQVFEWVGQEFQQLPTTQLGAWSHTEAVGRAVARLDWNLDGKPDLAVGLTDAPSYMLTNTCGTPGHFLSLRLVATASARDAIGTTIKATIGTATRVHQLTAGDGYQSSNERRLYIGCGPSAYIDRLSVVWPSGAKQEFREVPTDRSVILVEGRALIDTR